ncbi:MAG: hypothetical protein L6Q98_12370 [Anaerolineae bacterium]|nr:hypothetical protein [Anaerolineae bacterium]NUQ06302.1 hypothetical protein [Anaerolineae bacterium]
MAALPRVLSVDPTGRLSRVVRTAIDLSDLSVVQVDVPGGAEALEELRFAPATLVVTAVTLDGMDPDTDGITLATRIKRDYPLIPVVVIADPDEAEEEIATDAAFLYLRRPVDAAQVMRIINAGINFRDIFLATQQPARRLEPDVDIGGIPPLDPHFVGQVVDSLASDVRPMAILLANRMGEIIYENGAGGYLDRDALLAALSPAVRGNISMAEVVGKQPSVLHFYDGDQYDIFTLSVGFHYTLCIVMDGQGGQRQFGAVNRFGRRAVEDLLVMLGPSAFGLEIPKPAEEAPPRRRATVKAITQEVSIPNVVLERAETWEPEPVALPPEPEPIQMEPIANFDVSILDASLENLDALLAEADDLFDPERLAEIADESRRDRGPLTYDEARQLGILQ